MYNNNKQQTPWVRYILSVVAVMLFTSAFSNNSRYRFLNDKTQTSFKFNLVKNLIVIPVKVNDMELNLILDTGMRSIVLFGQRFARKLDVLEGRTVHLSGYGKKKNRPCKLSLDNEIVIADVLGKNVGIVIMPNPDLFKNVGLNKIHGIIGYEIFSRFKVKIDYPSQQITLFEPYVEPVVDEFEELPLTIQDTKPYVPARMARKDGVVEAGHFHIDTGSAQDVMMFLQKGRSHSFKPKDNTHVGIGIGGSIKGFIGEKSEVSFGHGYSKEVIPKYVEREFSNKELKGAQGSIGSKFLKDTVIILDYIHEKFYLKKNKQNVVTPTFMVDSNYHIPK